MMCPLSAGHVLIRLWGGRVGRRGLPGGGVRPPCLLSVSPVVGEVGVLLFRRSFSHVHVSSSRYVNIYIILKYNRHLCSICLESY